MNNNVYYITNDGIELIENGSDVVYCRKEKDDLYYNPISIKPNSFITDMGNGWYSVNVDDIKLINHLDILNDAHILNLNIEQLNVLGWMLTEFYNEISDDKAEIVMEVINKIEELG